MVGPVTQFIETDSMLPVAILFFPSTLLVGCLIGTASRLAKLGSAELRPCRVWWRLEFSCRLERPSDWNSSGYFITFPSRGSKDPLDVTILSCGSKEGFLSLNPLPICWVRTASLCEMELLFMTRRSPFLFWWGWDWIVRGNSRDSSEFMVGSRDSSGSLGTFCRPEGDEAVHTCFNNVG